MSPYVLRLRTGIRRLVDALTGAERKVARLIADPSVRWVAAIVIPTFIGFQAFSVAFQSALPHKMRSGFGFNIPWQMFANPSDYASTLEAVGIKANGEKVRIPVHEEIFQHYRGLMYISAFEEADWLMSPAPYGNMERKRELASFFRDRMAAWGVELVEVDLRCKIVTDANPNDVHYLNLGKFEFPPRPAN